MVKWFRVVDGDFEEQETVFTRRGEVEPIDWAVQKTLEDLEKWNKMRMHHIIVYYKEHGELDRSIFDTMPEEHQRWCLRKIEEEKRRKQCGQRN